MSVWSFRVWLSVARDVATELRRGGLRDLAQNIREREAELRVDLEARVTGTPLIEFDAKARRIKERVG